MSTQAYRIYAENENGTIGKTSPPIPGFIVLYRVLLIYLGAYDFVTRVQKVERVSYDSVIEEIALFGPPFIHTFGQVFFLPEAWEFYSFLVTLAFMSYVTFAHIFCLWYYSS